MNKDTGRIVVITGGGSGIGRAIAHTFAQNGDKVFILGRRIAKLQETAQGNSNIICVVADVTDIPSIEHAKNEIINQHGTVDVLVNCAGGKSNIDSDADTPEKLRVYKEIIETNLTSVFIMIEVFTEHMTKPGGRIINISSIAAFGGSRQVGIVGQAYSAAKSGIHGLTRSLVYKFAPDNITINCVSPGATAHTEFFDGHSMPESLAQVYLEKTPLRRLGEPSEIAAGVFYLASSEASFITGEILNISGGAEFGR